MTSKIAFTQSQAGGQRKGGLYVMNADGSGKRRLASSGSLPAWSPDGRKIAFGGLRVVNADGSGLQRLTRGTLPAWSPDGQRIAFTGLDEPGLYVINADGSGEQKLAGTRKDARSGRPTAGRSPSRARQPRGSRNFDIYVMNADGSGRRHLARTTYASNPAWSPDGRQIAFVRGYDIWVMNADGSEPAQAHKRWRA